jgi:hypothetical protein
MTAELHITPKGDIVSESTSQQKMTKLEFELRTSWIYIPGALVTELPHLTVAIGCWLHIEVHYGRLPI